MPAHSYPDPRLTPQDCGNSGRAPNSLSNRVVPYDRGCESRSCQTGSPPMCHWQLKSNRGRSRQVAETIAGAKTGDMTNQAWSKAHILWTLIAAFTIF